MSEVQVTIVTKGIVRKYRVSVDVLCDMLLRWNPLEGVLDVAF